MPKNTKTTAKKAAPKKQSKPKAEVKKKLSALDAAAQVLTENGGSMNTKEMIETMAARKLWESPNGKTPAATLYAAILREVAIKGTNSRFQKTEPGKFAATVAAKTAAKDEAPAPAQKPKAAKGAKKKPARKAEVPAPIPDGADTGTAA